MKYRRRATMAGTSCEALAVVSGALFLYTGVTMFMYTPVYLPMECSVLSNEMGPMRTDASWVNVTGTTTKDCWNPNRYELQATMTHEGTVWLRDGDSLTVIGSSIISPARVGARDSTVGEVSLDIRLPIDLAMSLFVKDELQVVAEMRMTLTGKLQFLGLPIGATKVVTKFCGFEVDVDAHKVGPTSCALSLEELVIPDVEEDFYTELAYLPDSIFHREARNKNLLFGSLLLLFGSLTAVAIHCCRRFNAPPRKRRKDLNKSAGQCGNPSEGTENESGADCSASDDDPQSQPVPQMV